MKRLIGLLLATMLLANSLCSSATVVSEYLLGVGDVLNIQVVGLDSASNAMANTANTNTASATTVNYNTGSSG